jgi:hypothetical protein
MYIRQVVDLIRAHPRWEWGLGLPVRSLPPFQIVIKKKRFCRHDDIGLLRDLPFSRNRPLKSAYDWYIIVLIILINIIFKKELRMSKMKLKENKKLWNFHFKLDA